MHDESELANTQYGHRAVRRMEQLLKKIKYIMFEFNLQLDLKKYI